MEKLNIIELKIPNLGEAESTEIIEINVKSGEIVKLNDPLIVLESEKAAMEVPSDYDGKIIEILVKEGDNVNEGQLFAKIEAKVTEKIKKEIEKPKPKDSVRLEESIKRDNMPITGINAGPAVRKYARELDIDTSNINNSVGNIIGVEELMNTRTSFCRICLSFLLFLQRLLIFLLILLVYCHIQQ